jgi:hypothetical protein
LSEGPQRRCYSPTERAILQNEPITHLLADNFGVPEKDVANLGKKRTVISEAITPA